MESATGLHNVRSAAAPLWIGACFTVRPVCQVFVTVTSRSAVRRGLFEMHRLAAEDSGETVVRLVKLDRIETPDTYSCAAPRSSP